MRCRIAGGRRHIRNACPGPGKKWPQRSPPPRFGHGWASKSNCYNSYTCELVEHLPMDGQGTQIWSSSFNFFFPLRFGTASPHGWVGHSDLGQNHPWKGRLSFFQLPFKGKEEMCAFFSTSTTKKEQRTSLQKKRRARFF